MWEFQWENLGQLPVKKNFTLLKIMLGASQREVSREAVVHLGKVLVRPYMKSAGYYPDGFHINDTSSKNHPVAVKTSCIKPECEETQCSSLCAAIKEESLLGNFTHHPKAEFTSIEVDSKSSLSIYAKENRQDVTNVLYKGEEPDLTKMLHKAKVAADIHNILEQEKNNNNKDK